MNKKEGKLFAVCSKCRHKKIICKGTLRQVCLSEFIECMEIAYLLLNIYSHVQICKRLRSPGIDYKESIPGTLKRLQNRAQYVPY
jgi:hypothetical protein